MTLKRLAILTTALLLATACGSERASTPSGFATLSGEGWTVAYPQPWRTSTVAGIRLAQGPKRTGGLAPQVAVAKDPKPPPFAIVLDAFRADQTVRRGDYTVTRDAPYELDGADDARLIELVGFLVQGVVAHPGDVEVEEFFDDIGTVYGVRVHPDDVGRIIGKDGRIANALRQLVKAAATKAGTHVMVEILTEDTPLPVADSDEES